MVFKQRKVLWAAAAAAAVALTLTACGASSTDTTEGESVIISPVVVNPPSLNPLANETAAYMLRGQFYDTLVRLNATDLSVEPGLAKSWEASDDGLTYTFRLQEGVSWHDGEPFTSEDVKYNLTEAMQYYSPLATTYALISDVQTPDENTAVVSLSSPAGYFLSGLANLYISPAHIYAGTDIMANPAWNTPVGTGPFKFESFEEGQQITGVKNEDYWDGEVQADRIVNPVIPDRNARNVALTNGDVNLEFRDAVDPSQLPTFEANDAFQVAPMVGAPEELITILNQREGRPLADFKVREAIMQAIDRDPIIERAYFGAAEAAPSAIPRKIAWATNEDVDLSTQYPLDIEAAGKLLDEAGYPAGADGTRFSLKLVVEPSQQPASTTAELLASDLDKIGIDLQVQLTDFQAVISDVWTAPYDFDIYLVQTSTEADPSVLLSTLYTCNPNDIPYSNATGICDEDIDALFTQAAALSDQDERGELFREADAAIVDTLYSSLPIVVTASPVVAAANVTGLEDFYSSTNWNWAALGTK
ncbi:ABC transporter substrate-binding protein [Microbacterium atlanticum]|uniref:ABC transporter substrate-binding protein n=1 Tax=Microbacterium atlanticum TaxID=2782168 RepID=UPI00188713FC|nr:ABC transporter substrate-binding protein [Microbacterium atlanticum]